MSFSEKHIGIHRNKHQNIQKKHLFRPDGSCHDQIENVSIAVVLQHRGRYHSTAWRRYDEVDKAKRFQLVKLQLKKSHTSQWFQLVSMAFVEYHVWLSLVSMVSKLALENYKNDWNFWKILSHWNMIVPWKTSRKDSARKEGWFLKSWL